MPDDTLFRTLPGINKLAFRLGLACNYGIDESGIDWALSETEINYLFWTPRMGRATPAVRRALRRDRDRFVVATGPTVAVTGRGLRRFVERALQVLGTDQLDVLQMHWLGVASRWGEGTVSEMEALRAEGKVRGLGVSIHNRKRAGKLAADSPLDVLMIRYNAAHPGAEQDIFPHVEPDRRAIVAYTATSWRRLLKRPRKWKGEIPDAATCYRFCLTNPTVSVVLTGPKTREQLQANLDGVKRGPLSEDEMKWMREFGAVVHG
ncbi:MAG: aldo/keto reductase [bacterium]|nr:aldo/keto reductase [bacterium]